MVADVAGGCVFLKGEIADGYVFRVAAGSVAGDGEGLHGEFDQVSLRIYEGEIDFAVDAIHVPAAGGESGSGRPGWSAVHRR